MIDSVQLEIDSNGYVTDCRSEAGITVGLINTIITAAHVLSTRNLASHEVSEALKNLREDAAVKHLFTCITMDDIYNSGFC